MQSNVKREKEIFLEYLKKNGLKQTAQKGLVLDTFLQTEGHLSVDDTYKVVKQKDNSIGYVTVYRTLKTLVACGLAREVDLGDGRTRFEHFYNHPHHHHIICTSCKKTIEFLSTDLEQLQEEIMKHYDFEVLYHSFQIYGLCPDCKNKQASASITKKDETINDKIFVRDALRLVTCIEDKGLSFYLAAAERTRNQDGRAMFYKIAADEKEHLNILRVKYDKLMQRNRTLENEPQFLHYNAAILNQLFPPPHEIHKLIPEDTNDLQALAIAIESERESYEFFQTYAERFKDSKGKKVFMEFTVAEKHHLLKLQKEYQRLKSIYISQKPYGLEVVD